MNRGLIIGIGVLAGAAIIAYLAIGQMSGEKTAVSQPQQKQQPVIQQEASPGSSLQSEMVINVTGSEYKYTPTAIDLVAGKPVKVVFKNGGKLPHDLMISDLGIKTSVIAGGKEETISFTPEKSGTFTFYCSVGNHRQLGMEGKLKVN